MTAGDDVGGGSDVIGSSVRGEKNVENNVPCQDDNEKHVLPGDKYVVAAADGLGSASLSHVGSDIATEAAVNYVENAVVGTESLDEETLLSVLRKAFVYAREQLHQKADSNGVPVSDLNTTLLVAVGGPAGVGGAAVGDGGIVAHRGDQVGLVIPREDTEYENKTIPLQSDNWETSYRSGWVADADAAAVFSDGLDGVAWDGPASVSDELFDQIFDNIREYSDLDELEVFLEDFLDGESLRKSSRDDKTLAVGALPAAEWTDPAEVEQVDTPFVEPPETPTADTALDSGDRSAAASLQQAEHGMGGGGGGQVVVDEQLGGNGTRRIAGVAAVSVLVVTIALAAVFFGPLSGSGGSAAEVELHSAELQGAQGVVIEGNAIGGEINDTGTVALTVSVREGQQDNEIRIGPPERTTEVDNNGDFTMLISPDNLPAATELDYYGETNSEYEIVVRSEGSEPARVSLTRGSLSLNILDVNVVSNHITGTLTQGGNPIIEETVTEPEGQSRGSESIRVMHDSRSLEPGVSYDTDHRRFNLSFDEETSLSGGNDLTITFAGASDSGQAPSFNVTIDRVTDQVTRGENVSVNYIIKNTGTLNGTTNIDVLVNGSVEDHNTTKISGSSQIDGSFTSQTGDSTPQNITVAVRTHNDTARTNVSVNPVNLSSLDIAGQGADATINESDNDNINVTVRNKGDQPGSFEVTLEIDSGDGGQTEPLEPMEAEDLGSGETKTLTFRNVTGDLAPGEYNVTASTHDGEVKGTLTVEQPPTPALSNLNITENGTSATITQGDNKSVNVTVKNEGGQTGSFDVTLAINSGDDGPKESRESMETDGLNSDETERLTFRNVTGDLAPGKYTVTASAQDKEVEGTLVINETGPAGSVGSGNSFGNPLTATVVSGGGQPQDRSPGGSVRAVRSVDRSGPGLHRPQLATRGDAVAQITRASHQYGGVP